MTNQDLQGVASNAATKTYDAAVSTASYVGDKAMHPVDTAKDMYNTTADYASSGYSKVSNAASDLRSWFTGSSSDSAVSDAASSGDTGGDE